jgi:hypothetical protein
MTMLKSRVLRIASLLLVLGWAGTVQAQSYYSVTGGGGQAQIGVGLPLPIQPATTGGTAMNPVGTGTVFPPLLIPLNANASKRLVKQTAGADPKQMTVPPSVFRRPGPGPQKLGVAPFNPKVFQVQTNIAFTGPNPGQGSMTFSAGGRTGSPTDTFVGIPATSSIRYTATANQFGGPSQTRVIPATPIVVWANALGAMLPCKHPAFAGVDGACLAPLIGAFPDPTAAAGGPVGFVNSTVPVPPMSPGWVVLSIPNIQGSVAMQAPIVTMNTGLTNMATSAGFPWTTGMITISQPSALGAPEVFTLTGMDQRVNGIGTISLVSGALSQRTLSGPNANRSWARYTLPEPGAVLGAAAALAVLGVCHGLVRRRSR